MPHFKGKRHIKEALPNKGGRKLLKMGALAKGASKYEGRHMKDRGRHAKIVGRQCIRGALSQIGGRYHILDGRYLGGGALKR